MINIYYLSNKDRHSARVIINALGLSIDEIKPDNERVVIALAREGECPETQNPVVYVRREEDIISQISEIVSEVVENNMVDISHINKLDNFRWVSDVDFLSVVSYLAIREEEYLPTNLDIHGRFNHCYSILSKLNTLERPLLNYIIEFVRRAFDRILSHCGLVMPYVERWPGSAPFAISITLDIDHIRKIPLPLSILNPLSSLKRLRLKDVWKHSRDAVRAISSFNKVCMDVDRVMESIGGEATIFVGGKRRHPLDPEVDAFDERAKYLIRAFRDGCVELALHGSYASMLSGEDLSEERAHLEDALGRAVDGVRMHYLRVVLPQTIEKMDEEGFIYDSSIGYSDATGFRSGLALPYKPLYGGNIIELPPSIMDTTLFFKMNIGYDDALSKAVSILDEVEGVSGYISSISHYKYMVFDEYELIRRFIVCIREEIERRGGLIMNCRGVCRWWLARSSSRFKVFASGNALKVEFELPQLVLDDGRVGFLGQKGAFKVEYEGSKFDIIESIETRHLKRGSGIFRLVK